MAETTTIETKLEPDLAYVQNLHKKAWYWRIVQILTSRVLALKTINMIKLPFDWLIISGY